MRSKAAPVIETPPSAPEPPPPPIEPSPSSASPKPAREYATAETMAKAQRSISVSEFFAKNRHLLGFDNPRKALLTTVKEAVDNALDACEEAGILPVVEIAIEQLGETHFRVAVQDNGPGIVRKQIPNVFGQLLYGSKFHRLRMSRGQQGIGISAAGMYGLLTTGQPVRITSRTKGRDQAHYYELQIDTRKNRPDIIRDTTIDWEPRHGTRVEIELEARYQRGRQSVDDYLQQTAIANPHVTLVYRSPDGRESRYDAQTRHLPEIPKAIRPHPYGIELGVLLKMFTETKARTCQKFLCTEFSRVSPRSAKEILEKANLPPQTRPGRLNGDQVKAVYQAIQQTRLMAPATNCVVPIGEDKLVAGLQQVVKAQFYTAVTRSPAVYRGNPFIIETALAYGKPEQAEDAAPKAAPAGEQAAPGADDEEDEGDQELAKLVRFANRVPLLYQQSACAIYKSVAAMNWRAYGLQQGRGALPVGDLTVVVHMASVWVPFTSESKEAIASYPEILKEIRLALQECGRRLGTHIRKNVRIRQELKKRSYIEKYIPAIGEALRDILELKDAEVTRTCHALKDILQRSRKM
ncbi:MAG TPA: DNA topoisomerase VI subunit B [Phycisphaerae bacterium]|nr:DNA topoisomerase VI subunit B [Phycisphaerae bacterium]HQL72888.1 DNA topoisomerase VI subunit B [Phycisphaerae bacterium]